MQSTETGPAWHSRTNAEVLAGLETDAATGLSADEAARRLVRHGPNAITPGRRTGALVRFLLQFHQPLIYILLAAGAVTALLGEPVDATVICGVVLVNAVVGYLQEAKAVAALSALARSMVTEAAVLRDGAWQVIAAEGLVPGDIVRLRSGDKVPADLRLLSVQSLRLDESALTGESVPVDKAAAPLPEDTILAERSNLAFAATVAAYGQGLGVVTATGDNAAIGRIAALTAAADDLATPLTRAIARFSHLVLYGILALAGLTFAVGVARGQPAADMFMAAVALAVGAIPEGLPAAVTVILAIGVSRMAARRAVVRRLPAVETLGSTTVICTDKTGTLTQNRMTVSEVVLPGGVWTAGPDGFTPAAANAGDGRQALHDTLAAAALCNDAVLDAEGDGFTGDPTEAALLVAAKLAGLDPAALAQGLPRLADEPFESERMYMATLHATGRDRPVLLLFKGSVEATLPRCHAGPGAPLDAAAIRRTVEDMGRRGLRVLALARRELPPGTAAIGAADHGSGLTFLGLIGMIDPARPEAVAAVAACRRAGIMVKMITGDHAATAAAIGADIGLSGNDPVKAMTGRDIDAAPPDSLPRLAEATHVFARVSPEQKLRLVKALQGLGHVCAMTGDGVNDAPALKQADIGVAMGRGGTEAAKEAADMVLTDDNFATIEAAVEEGRGVFDNLTKFIVWTLPTNLGEGLVILTAVLLGVDLPISPVQILWINMTTAGSLGLMLAFEPREPGVMARPPRDPGRPILDARLMRRVLVVGGALLVASFGLYEWELAHGAGPAAARTVAVNVFVAMEALYLLNCRSLRRPALSLPLAGNPWVLWGMIGAVALQGLFTYAPFMQKLFGSAAIAPMAWVRILGAAVAGFLLVEAQKHLENRG
ncbi:Cation-transporting ATPase, E1-E2 family [Desulfovibrio sp. DV]|uniref:HAD-IC family P-type ATPase n=1 Tax=Desulfovibrio sp. DV TaxID=1844708 RepID=UPI00094BA06A|nr:HAD-IC family P-type ATPase [Desulfovibrio sp. DV]OLN24975.1 Cation-transporting ATPase, E1-E2 family [Desulfovibrio sp. DV]